MIVFDIDGVLANVEHRKHFIDPEKDEAAVFEYDEVDRHGCPVKEGGTWHNSDGSLWIPDYKSYDAACDKDEPIQVLHTILYDIMGSNRCADIEIWTGRCESLRAKTEKWLDYHCGAFFNGSIDGRMYLKKLRMRPIGNSDPTCDLKNRWLNELMWTETLGIGYIKHPIEMVFDADPNSIHMWKRHGIFVFDCRQNTESAIR